MTTFQIPFDEFLSSAAGFRQCSSQQKQQLSEENLGSILSGLFGQGSNNDTDDQSFSPRTLNFLFDNVNVPRCKVNNSRERKAFATIAKPNFTKPNHRHAQKTSTGPKVDVSNVKSKKVKSYNIKTVSPPLDAYETESSYTIYISLAGVSQNDINIDYEPSLQSLTVYGVLPRSSSDPNAILKISERSYGKFKRVVRVPKDVKVDDEGVTAKFNNGLLVIDFPKAKEVKKQKRRIILESGPVVDTEPASLIQQNQDANIVDQRQVEELEYAEMTNSTSEDNDDDDDDIYQTKITQEGNNNNSNSEKDLDDPEDNWDIVNGISNSTESEPSAEDTMSVSGNDSAKNLSRQPSVEDVEDEEFSSKSV